MTYICIIRWVAYIEYSYAGLFSRLSARQVAKGPNSSGVVRLARELGGVSVRGNHEFEVRVFILFRINYSVRAYTRSRRWRLAIGASFRSSVFCCSGPGFHHASVLFLLVPDVTTGPCWLCSSLICGMSSQRPPAVVPSLVLAHRPMLGCNDVCLVVSLPSVGGARCQNSHWWRLNKI